MEQTYKIGDRIIFDNAFMIETVCNGTKEIRKGDKGIVRGDNLILIISGEGRGETLSKEGIFAKGYNCVDIASTIYEVLKSEFYINDMLEYNEIEEVDFVDSIYDILKDILG